MKTFKITEEQLFKLLRNSFVAGELFAEDFQDCEIGVVEEVTEPDFDEYYESLDLEDYAI